MVPVKLTVFLLVLVPTDSIILLSLVQLLCCYLVHVLSISEGSPAFGAFSLSIYFNNSLNEFMFRSVLWFLQPTCWVVFIKTCRKYI